MARISTYPIDTTPKLTDKVVGTEVEEETNATMNYLLSDVLTLGVNQYDVKLKSPNGSVYKLDISNAGVITSTLVP
tara:strand:- start:834 stop:1061 length:228 start_codon:yes stop_codon:yes gene_type:complete